MSASGDKDIDLMTARIESKRANERAGARGYAVETGVFGRHKSSGNVVVELIAAPRVGPASRLKIAFQNKLQAPM